MSSKFDPVAEPDEPVFTLCGRDPAAPVAVAAWAAAREANDRLMREVDKIREARAIAEAMRQWREENIERITVSWCDCAVGGSCLRPGSRRCVQNAVYRAAMEAAGFIISSEETEK